MQRSVSPHATDFGWLTTALN